MSAACEFATLQQECEIAFNVFGRIPAHNLVVSGPSFSHEPFHPKNDNVFVLFRSKQTVDSMKSAQPFSFKPQVRKSLKKQNPNFG